MHEVRSADSGVSVQDEPVALMGTDRSGAERRAAIPSRRIWLHAGLLLVLLVVMWPLVTNGSVFHADEGAALAQERLLDRTGEWTAPNPEPQLDPAMEAVPLELSDRVEGGRWAPFLKHPVYVGMLRATSSVAGDAGPVLVSILGAVVAAAAAGLLAERVRAGSGLVGLWIAGLATPLFFDAYVVQAHSVGAAAAGWAAVAVSRTVANPRRWVLATVAAVGLVGFGVLVRTEFLFIGAGLAAGVAVAGRFRPRPLAAGAALAAAAAATWYLESRWLVRSLAGGPPAAEIARHADSQRGEDLWPAFRVTFLSSSYGGGIATWYGSLGVLAASGVALASRRRGSIVRVALVVAVLGYVGLAANNRLISGHLIATPALAGLAGLSGATVRSRLGSLLLVAWTVFVVAVAVTQYGGGGGAHWGGRYFVAGLPLVVPMAAAGWCEVLDRLDGELRRLVRYGAVLCTAALVLLAGSTMMSERRAVGGSVDTVLAARSAGAGGPVPVLSTTGIVPRFAWEHVDEGTWLTVVDGEVEQYAGRLARTSDQVVLVSFDLEGDLAAIDEWYRLDRQVDPWVAVVLRR